MSKNYLTQAQRYALGKALEASLTLHPDGTCEYKDGINDTSLLEAFNQQHRTFCAVYIIQDLRRQLFGNLRGHPFSKNPFPSELADLRRRVELLEHWARHRPKGPLSVLESFPLVK